MKHNQIFPMRLLLFIFLLISIVTQVTSSNICKHYGSKCPIEAPCCNQGYCSSSIRFCSTGCEPNSSYTPSACFPHDLCLDHTIDFTSSAGKSLVVPYENYSFDPNKEPWSSEFIPNYARVAPGNGLELSMRLDDKRNEYGRLQGFGSTVFYNRWVRFVNMTARMKTSAGSGVVTSFITRSPEGDEIDFEWVGKALNETQTNYYWHDVLNHTNGGIHLTFPNTQAEWHEYELRWMPDYISWLVDGKLIRTLWKRDTWDADLKIFRFPDTDSRISFSIWDGGASHNGTMEWAGVSNWEKEPKKVFTAYVASVKISCYKQTNDSTPMKDRAERPWVEKGKGLVAMKPKDWVDKKKEKSGTSANHIGVVNGLCAVALFISSLIFV